MSMYHGDAQITQAEIDYRLSRALSQFCSVDQYLIERDVSERGVCHHLARHLERVFPHWDVDCEFNRHIDEIKRLTIGPVFPDIIIHCRGTDNNLLVIEVKKSTNPKPDRCDLDRLEGFKNTFGYRYAVFIKLRTGMDKPGLDYLCWR